MQNRKTSLHNKNTGKSKGKDKAIPVKGRKGP
jgi:hypothetical protein